MTNHTTTALPDMPTAAEAIADPAKFITAVSVISTQFADKTELSLDETALACAAIDIAKILLDADDQQLSSEQIDMLKAALSLFQRCVIHNDNAPTADKLNLTLYHTEMLHHAIGILGVANCSAAYGHVHASNNRDTIIATLNRTESRLAYLRWMMETQPASFDFTLRGTNIHFFFYEIANSILNIAELYHYVIDRPIAEAELTIAIKGVLDARRLNNTTAQGNA